MTPNALREALRVLHWTPGDLAHHLGQSVNRIRNWVRTDKPYTIPPAVSAWLLRRVALHEQAMRDDPPPGS